LNGFSEFKTFFPTVETLKKGNTQAMHDCTEAGPSNVGPAGAATLVVHAENEIPYGTPPNCTLGTVMPSVRPKPAVCVSLTDRTSHLEEFLMSFVAEKSVPFSMFSLVPDLTELAKEMSRDHKAFEKLEMSRTTASYKIREGHGVVNHKRLVNDLKESKFSMNLDECFKNSNC
jgi:hypothetical protein